MLAIMTGVAAVAVTLLLTREGVMRPLPSPREPETSGRADHVVASRPETGARITPRVVAPDIGTDSREQLVISRRQREVLQNVRRLLGQDTPKDLTKALDDEEIASLKKEVEDFTSRERALSADYQQKGVARAQAVYDAGGWQIWPERQITIPYPGKPGKTITRNASPYDDKVEDEFISETGALGADGKLENHVVRLRPDNVRLGRGRRGPSVSNDGAS
jgi:hypothetical protein